MLEITEDLFGVWLQLVIFEEEQDFLGLQNAAVRHKVLLSDTFGVVPLLFEVLHCDLDVVDFDLLEQILDKVVDPVCHEHSELCLRDHFHVLYLVEKVLSVYRLIIIFGGDGSLQWVEYHEISCKLSVEVPHLLDLIVPALLLAH